MPLPRPAQMPLTDTIKRYKLGNVHAYARKGQIYLVRTDV